MPQGGHLHHYGYYRTNKICDPLCEIQAKISKFNNEITSIKVEFQPLISMFDMALLSQF